MTNNRVSSKINLVNMVVPLVCCLLFFAHTLTKASSEEKVGSLNLTGIDAVRKLIARIDDAQNANKLKFEYFMRRAVEDYPVERGYADIIAALGT